MRASIVPVIALWIALGTGSDGSAAASGAADSPSQPAPALSQIPVNAHILVDQFGYRPGDPKVAVVRNPQIGFDSSDSFAPGSMYQVRRADDGQVAFKGGLAPWNKGAVETSSGDSGWWFDFSSVSAPGRYFVYDVERNVRSSIFRIDEQVYNGIFKAAVRMYFYQRSGTAKRRPYAEQCWTDDPVYEGSGQDTEARDVTDRDNRAKIRDLRGGWFDAGDTNKYVTFAAQPVHQLLTAYQENPKVFTDDFNIPESGNGVPDILDEVKWETDWLKRMQSADGSAALKVGEIVYGSAAPPSSDHNARFYVPSCTSATIAAAGMFAHAAYVFAGIPQLASEAKDLRGRAVSAWKNYQSHATKETHCDTGVVHAGLADWTEQDQGAESVVAAVYLFAITDQSDFDAYVREHYRELQPYHDMGWSRYRPEQGEALLFYSTLAHADTGARKAIEIDKQHDAQADNHVYGFSAGDDLYRAYMHDAQYHWGSNAPRAGYGNSNADMLTYHLDDRNAQSYRTRALDVLHYFHGVNPFAMVYLSNMYSYGATRSVNEIFHAWFSHGTKWSDAKTSECGPAPGYVPGGPNANAAQSGVPASLKPPSGQPPQKSYRDWNVGTPENSWAITEPAIYYQSGYVKLLSKFVQ